MADQDRLKDDPFFRLPAHSDWNAFIGLQGNEDNYLDGYIEAAIELLDTVIENKKFDKRDTLVLPILYTARHAIELTLKLAVNRLADVDLLPRPERVNHNIQKYLEVLEKVDLGDKALREIIGRLKPFVSSLSRIDDDGQELRYPINLSKDRKSLSEYSLANLEVIRDSVKELSEVLSDLRYRIDDFIDERKTGAHTERLSRRDLVAIAKMLPPLDHWEEEDYREKKRELQSDYGLSEGEFSKAIEIIKTNREMKALIGVQTSLLYLPDQLIVLIAEQWRKLHPARGENDPFVVTLNEATFKRLEQYGRTKKEVVSTLEARLTDQQVAELEVISSLGRNRWRPEMYEDQVQQTIERHKREGAISRQISDIIEKPNFFTAVVTALPRIGRPSLAAELSRM